MSRKLTKVEVLESQVNEAIETVRKNAGYGDWYMGYKAGASSVAVELSKIRRRDAEMKRDGLERGSP